MTLSNPLTPQSRSLLLRARDRTFADGASQLVVVVGSGLHHHLVHRLTQPQRGDLSNWDALIASVLERGMEARNIEDLTARWESMVVDRVGMIGHQPASHHESVLQGRIARCAQEGTMPAAALSRFSSQVRYRDLVTLNFDRTLDRCLTDREDSKVILRPPEHQPGQVRQTIHVSADGTRVWHAHGIADVAASIQLGVHGYVSSCSAIVGGLATFRERVRTWAEGRGIKRGSSWTDEHVAEWHESLRGEQTEGLQWWHVVMTSDVAFIGCGLDRAELDLWLVLHERQRQLARVPEATRPKAFYIHPWRDFPKHIASEPAGITSVVTEDHSEGWRLIFGESWG